MALEPTGVSEEVIGSLTTCFVEGDPEQQRRERKLRRRALVVSITLQTVVVAALAVFPLPGRTERVTYQPRILPPYAPSGPVKHPTAKPNPPNGGKPACIVCFNHNLPPTLKPGEPVTTTLRAEPTKRLKVTSLEPAMLIRRVEPLYPALAKQTGREGRVELRAIIASDGSIQSLEVLFGDPLFYSSALAAVREWRYRPTYLNGQAFEIDTRITVVYKLLNR